MWHLNLLMMYLTFDTGVHYWRSNPDYLLKKCIQYVHHSGKPQSTQFLCIKAQRSNFKWRCYYHFPWLLAVSKYCHLIGVSLYVQGPIETSVSSSRHLMTSQSRMEANLADVLEQVLPSSNSLTNVLRYRKPKISQKIPHFYVSKYCSSVSMLKLAQFLKLSSILHSLFSH